MAPVQNGRVLFGEIPDGYPVPGKTTYYDESETIDVEGVALNGGVLVKVLALSVDPYLRGRMRDPSIESYAPAYIKGEPLDSFGVGVILRSEDDAFKKGQHIYGVLPWQEYAIYPAHIASGFRFIENTEKLPWSVYTGIAGMPGLTAWGAWREYASAKAGQTAFVTTGAGVVGSFVIQLAKADGLKVIASAGSKEKVTFMKSLGADVVFNYKTTNTLDVLKKEGPIDVYWDNVGGEVLDAALETASVGAHFIECGMISTYNGQVAPIKNMNQIYAREIKMSGFIAFSLQDKYQDQFYQEVPKMVASGRLKYREDIKHGLQYAGNAILDVQSGKNTGKSVVVVAEDD